MEHQDPEVVSSVERGVTLRFLEAQHLDGDGRMTVFLQPGNFAPPQILHDATAESDAWVELNTHTHANWVFTEPGTYLVRIAMEAQGIDGTSHTDDAMLRFSVGDAADEAEAAAAAWPGEEPVAELVEDATQEQGSATTDAPATDASAAASEEDSKRDDGDSALPWIIGAGVVVAAGGAASAFAATRRRQRMEDEVFSRD